MVVSAEHDSLQDFLRSSLTDQQRARVLLSSFTQWEFALAALTDIAACLHSMGSEVMLALWSNRTPMHDTGWSVDDKVARLARTHTRDEYVREALINFGIPRSDFVEPPITRWKPAQSIKISVAMNRSQISALEYFGSPMGRAILQVKTLTDAPVTDRFYWPIRLLRRAALSYAFVYDQTRGLIAQRQVTAVVCYNGRFLHDRAAAAAAQSLGIPVLYYDNGGTDTAYDLTESITHDWSQLQRRMLDLYERWPSNERDALGSSWFEDRMTHSDPSNALFIDAQEIGHSIERPQAESLVVYFSSSGDEIADLELDWERFIGSQPQALRILADLCRERPGFKLVVRSHPHKRRKPKQDVEEWLSAVESADPDIHLGPDSSVDSYALMKQANIVVTYGSTTGVEAAYLYRDVIVLGPSAYDELGCATFAGSVEELSAALDHCRERNRQGAIAFGLMMRRRGFNFECVEVGSDGQLSLAGYELGDASKLAKDFSHLLGRVQRLTLR